MSRTFVFVSIFAFFAAAPVSAQAESTGSTPLRLAAEFGGGALATAGTFALSWGIGTLAAEDALDRARASDEECDFCGLGEFIVWGGGTYLLLAPVTVSAGTYFAGEAAGGDGNYWATMLGTAGGGVAAVGAGLLIGSTGLDDGMGELIFASAMVLPVLGSMLGYELTNKSAAERARASGRPSFAPSAGVTADGRGATVALAGRF